jgi:hypothetical protein
MGMAMASTVPAEAHTETDIARAGGDELVNFVVPKGFT